METAPYFRKAKRLAAGSFALILPGTAAVPVAADDFVHVENFSFDRWEAGYELEIVDDVAIAHVTETMVVQFPDYDQNRGLDRRLPLRHEGAPAGPENITVTDADGAEVPFETEAEDGMRVILIGGDDYVHGQQTYQLSYTVQNIIHSPARAEGDVFSWELVPSSRPQPIDQASAEITLSPEFAETFTGDASCSTDTSRSAEPCPISADDSDPNTLVVPELSLDGGDGLVVDLEFSPGTVPEPAERQDNWFLDILPVLLGLLSVGLGVVALVLRVRLRRQRRDDTGGTAPKHGIPLEEPLIVTAALEPEGPKAEADIVRLALRGAVRIEDSDRDQGAFVQTRRPMLRLVDPALAEDPMDQLLLATLFPDLKPGDTFVRPVKARDRRSLRSMMDSVLHEGRAEAETRGYCARERSRQAMLLACAALLLIPVIGVLLLMGLTRDNPVTAAFALMGAAVSLVIAVPAFRAQWVHTPEGARLLQQLESVRSAVQDAERDWKRLLKAEENTQQQTFSEADAHRFYESLAPFAVLFNVVNQWAEFLEDAYGKTALTEADWLKHTPPAFSGDSGLQSAVNSMINTTSSSSGGSATASTGSGSGGGSSGSGGSVGGR